MYKKAQKIRLSIVFFFFLLILLIILVRLLNIQVLNNQHYLELADSQHHLTLTLYPQRGLIYDRNLKVLALSLKVFSVYAEPRLIDNKLEVAQKLADLLDLDYDKTLTQLQKDKSFVWIKRRIEQNQAQAVNDLKLYGVGLLKENKRYYPNNELAAHVLGFTGIDDSGLEGLELEYDSYLKGESGYRSLLRDAKQRMLPAFEYEYVPAMDGYNLVLTIDQIIQHIVEEELNKAFDKNQAKGASVLVMNPENGEIFALANRPGYDLNLFETATSDQRRNRAVCDYFEPGSTFKIITATAALSEKAVELDEVFFCENGTYQISRHTLHDHRPHGDLTFVEVIEKSSNIGTVKVAQKLGAEVLYKYIKNFEFAEKTSIDLSGETAGFLRPVAGWSKLSIAAIPIGHEIGVSVLQMAKAMAVIANGGYLVKPHLVNKIIDNNQQIIKEFDYSQKKSIISPDIAKKMQEILKGVVERGTAKKAKIDGYTAAGKTGTAQKLNPQGGYSHDLFIASFIGFAPVKNPKVVIAVVFDEPKPVYYGGVVCAPIFKNIAEKVLRYMNTEKESK
ncbi:MAG: penicillin-binding transpeptidase domain-containing protein [Candidatus Omnitrophota bacterium]